MQKFWINKNTSLRIRNFLADKFCHPLKGNIGESRFAFRVASTDIRMISRKPHLGESRNAVDVAVRYDARPSPRDADKVSSIFIYCHSVPGEGHVPYKMHVILERKKWNW